jgi:hypothetical protein
MIMSQANHTNHRTAQPAGSSELPRSTDALAPVALEQIRESLKGLKFGTISIIVQDGVIVQIERLEKRRLRKAE